MANEQLDAIAGLIHERNLERAAMIIRMSTARSLLIRAKVYIDGTINQARAKGVKEEDLQILLKTQDEIKQFIDEGFFGEKAEVKS